MPSFSETTIHTRFDSKNILELGSGLGLCGILSEHLTDEKASIRMTDGDTDTLAHLRSNIQKSLGNCSLNAGFVYDECEETDPNEDLFVYKFRKKPCL